MPYPTFPKAGASPYVGQTGRTVVHFMDKIGFQNGRLRLGATTIGHARIKNGMVRVVNESEVSRATRTVLTVSTSATLVVNSHNTLAASNAATFTLPSGDEGDFITVLLIGAVNNGQTLKFAAPTGSFFSKGSKAFVEGQDGTRVAVINQANGTSNDFFNIVGLTNGDGGIGSELKFTCLGGTNWAADIYITGQGAMSAASANTVFADA
jgi:hypothetical protein